MGILITRLLGLTLCMLPMTAFVVLHFLGVRDGLVQYFDVGTIFATLIAMTLGYIPVLGSLVGYYGAVYAWGWDWYWALVVFLWYLPVAAAVILVKLFFMYRNARG